MYSPLDQFDVIPLKFVWLWKFDLTFFSILIPILIMLVLILLFNNFYVCYKLIPSPLQKILEGIIEFIFDIIKNQIGKEGYIFLPFICSLFLFVLIANLLGVIPFGIALTSHFLVTLWLSLSIFCSIVMWGLFYNNLKFFMIFIPKCPLLLLPILILIELFSYCIRAFSLAIRLTANILAGHTLVNIISVFIVNTLKLNWLISFLGFGGLILILFLEIGVAFLQAYVFSILICIYLRDIFHIEH